MSDGSQHHSRTTYLNWIALHDLNRFGGYVLDAFGHYPYLVGSALVRTDYRDVDVRLILPDDEFAATFGEVLTPRYTNAKWNATCVVWTHFAAHLTGLPIEFQIDQQTWANENTTGRRHAIGGPHGLGPG